MNNPSFLYFNRNPILKPTWFIGHALPSTSTDILQEEASNFNSDEGFIDANAIVENNTDDDLHDYVDFSANDSFDELFDEYIPSIFLQTFIIITFIIT